MHFKPYSCPKCSETQSYWEAEANPLKGKRWFIKKGYYRTQHDGQYVPRYQCKRCKLLFCSRTHLPSYRQKKPKLNKLIFKWYCSGATQRRIAANLGINRLTVVRKFLYLSRLATDVHNYRIDNELFKTNHIQFDEMESYEHTLAKPVSIALAVCSYTGHIIDMQAGTMKSHGRLSNVAVNKYGFREDTREVSREDVFLTIKRVQPLIATIVTDKHGSYPHEVERLLPGCKLIQKKRIPRTNNDSRRNTDDNLWRVNHLCSKLRNDLARLRRKTWATTKTLWALQAHLDLYIAYNNGYDLA